MENTITTKAGNVIEQRTGEDPLLKGGKKSAWMTHVKKTMRANKGKPLSAVLKMAAKSYKKTAKVSKKKKSRGLFGMYGGLSTSAGPGSSTAGDVGGQMEGMSNYGSMGGRRHRGGDYHTGGTHEMGGRRNSKKNGSKKY
jgi:hypothetical protein